MYSIRIQYLAIFGSVILLIFILFLIRRQRLKEEYSILWLIFGFLFLILSIWRDGVDFIAGLVGIAYPPAALLLILLMAQFVIMIEFSTIISKISKINTHLSQDVALLKNEVLLVKKELESLRK